VVSHRGRVTLNRIDLPGTAEVGTCLAPWEEDASQLSDREGAGPVLPPGIVAHFTRDQEVLLR
jgi:hypothetical protein